MEYDISIVFKSLPYLLQGAKITVELTAISVALGTVLGLCLALMRLSSVKVFKYLALSYIDFFRGTPLLVQIFIVHFGFPQIFGYTPNAFMSGILALSLNSGAYVAEIFRAGIQSIDKGQMEAARSLGMSYYLAMVYIILPQAFKRVIPPLGNEFIAMLKDSSLVVVISVPELMLNARSVAGREFRFFEVYTAAAFLYLVMTMSISRLVTYMERRLKVDDSH